MTAGFTGKEKIPRVPLKEVAGKNMSLGAASRDVPVKNVKNALPVVNLRDISHEAAPKFKVHEEVLHHNLEASTSGKVLIYESFYFKG